MLRLGNCCGAGRLSFLSCAAACALLAGCVAVNELASYSEGDADQRVPLGPPASEGRGTASAGDLDAIDFGPLLDAGQQQGSLEEGARDAITAVSPPLESSKSRASEGEAPDPGPPDAGLGSSDASWPPPPIDATSPAVCASPGVLGPNGRCFATVATLLSGPAARQRCRSFGNGWDLASIRSPEVNQFLAELLTSESWIGASDANREGTWVWVDDRTVFWRGNETGSPVNAAFSNWSRTEPNGKDTSDCARLVPGAGSWADLECDELRSAVCGGPPG
jgi:hypothetical protein